MERTRCKYAQAQLEAEHYLHEHDEGGRKRVSAWTDRVIALAGACKDDGRKSVTQILGLLNNYSSQ